MKTVYDLKLLSHTTKMVFAHLQEVAAGGILSQPLHMVCRNALQETLLLTPKILFPLL